MASLDLRHFGDATFEANSVEQRIPVIGTRIRNTRFTVPRVSVRIGPFPSVPTRNLRITEFFRALDTEGLHGCGTFVPFPIRVLQIIIS